MNPCPHLKTAKGQKITLLFFSSADSPASYSELVIGFSEFICKFSPDSDWFLFILACFFALITFITSATKSHNFQSTYQKPNSETQPQKLENSSYFKKFNFLQVVENQEAEHTKYPTLSGDKPICPAKN